MKKLNFAVVILLLLVFMCNSAFAAKYRGDINGDNKLDVLDVRLLLQEYLSNNRK